MAFPLPLPIGCKGPREAEVEVGLAINWSRVLGRVKGWVLAMLAFAATKKIRAVLDRVAAYRKNSSDQLFPAPRGGGHVRVRDTFQVVCEAAGITKLVVHDLRRSLISASINKGGVSIEHVAKAVGHQTTHITSAVYSHPDMADRLAIQSRMTATLASVLAG